MTVRAIALVVASSLAGVPAMTAQRGGPPNAQPRGSALILGQVVDGKDGRPVAGATVTLSGGPSPAMAMGAMGPGASVQVTAAPGPSRVLSDSQGRFVFMNLPAGSYTLTAAGAGYMGGAHGQLRPGGSSRPVVLQADQKLGGVVIPLWRLATVSGVVMDEGGDPVIAATVRAMKRSVFGRTVRLSATQSARTDDRGMYRMSLIPGDYLIELPSSTTTVPVSVVETYQTLSSARDGGPGAQALREQLQASGAPFPGPGGIRIGSAYLQQNGEVGPTAFASGNNIFVQPTLFYAGATTAGAATLVTLAPGDERSNVDFQMNPVLARTVSGTVTGPDGLAANMGVRLMPASLDEFMADDGIGTATTVTNGQGAFTFLGVPPGPYALRVLRIPRPVATNRLQGPNGPVQFAYAPRAQPPTDPTLYANVAVAVGDRDVTGLAVPLRVGPHVTGRIVFDGTAQKPAGPGLQQITISLQRIGGETPGQGLMPAFPGTDGQFTTMSAPPGKYLVSASAPGWQLKSAEVNGRDVSEGPLDLDSNDVGGLVITFYDRPAQLSGAVHDARGTPDANATVLLFPADYRSWIDSSMSNRRFRTTRAGTGGTFSIGGLLPGDYLVIAINEATLADTLNRPDVIEAAAALALRVSVGEAARQTQDLTTVQLPIR